MYTYCGTQQLFYVFSQTHYIYVYSIVAFVERKGTIMRKGM